MKTNETIIFDDENPERLIQHLAKIVSKELKKDTWFKYTFCLKKCKDGAVIVRQPISKEL